MKKLLVILLVITTSRAVAQCNIKELVVDVKKMYTIIDTLHNEHFEQFVAKFYDAGAPQSRDANNPLLPLKLPLLSALERSINNIKLQFQDPPNDSTCFYQNLNKEISDYVASLKLLRKAVEIVVTSDGGMNTFGNSNFVAAYNYMSTSRALLMAAMDNLRRHNEMQDAVRQMEKSIVEGKKETRKWGLITLLFVIVGAVAGAAAQ